jgi:GNAT superfamily N-acetyltransferase
MRNDVGMQIRSAEPRDLDVLCQLRIEFLTEYRGLAPDAVSDHFVDETRRFFQRSGIGRLLLRACLASAPDYGIRRFNLYATEAGRPLYVNEGFSHRDDWMVLHLPHSS